ncbi:Dockerin type I repeat protein [Planctomycetes bacterium CA13]|uniref:Dockerin type I repeat protein n=2 Tax=Novipirellula herctigrandis TaxID=2527986 RepID=A0A5C5Z885_9BACT|nr:Dockerin type I repeat protein [Planctomycetes bacterium CA13]
MLFEPLEDRMLLDGGGLIIPVSENQLDVIDVDDIGSVSVGPGAVYSLSGGADQALFSLDPTTGILTFTTAPDFEMVADADSDNIYDVQVTLTDAALSSELIDYCVQVENVNETPVAEANGPYTLTLGDDLTLDATGSIDPDASDVLTFDWDLDGDMTVDFTSANATYIASGVSYDGLLDIGVNTITLEVTDAGGLSSTDTATVEAFGTFTFSPLTDGTADAYTLIANGGDLEILDSNTLAVLASAPVAYVLDVEILGSDDNDTFTIDFSGGPIEAPIQYAGGNQTSSPGDVLVLVGGTTTSVEHTFVDESSGSVALAFTASSADVTYSGLEPVIDNLNAADRVFTFTGGAETITLSDDALVGFSRIDSTLGEVVTFANPTNSLTVNAGTGADTFNLVGVDPTMVASVTINGDDGNDDINVQSVLATTPTTVNGNAGNDTIIVGSTTNELDSIVGNLSVQGGSNALIPMATKNVIANGNAVAQTLAVGDTLRINDQGYNAAAQYELDDGSFSRDTTVAVTNYGAIETIVLNAGLAANDIDILDTPDDSNTTVRGQDGVDNVTVTLTGDGSILGVSTKGANDVFEFTNTGVESVSHVFMGDGDDMATQVTSGAGSGIRYDAQAGDDTITIENAGAVSPLPGAQSSSTLVIGSNVALAATDDDAINLYASPVDSFQALYGGIGNDLFTLGSTSNEISGILGSVLVEGGDNELLPTVTKNVIANGNAVAQTLAVGDTLRINDQGYNAAAQYELDDGSFSRDTTVAVTNYGAIETIVLNAGLAANDIDILDTPDDSNTTVRGQDGVDNVTVTLTGDGSILGVSTKGANDVFEFTNTGVESVSHVFMGDGNDMATQVTSGAGSGIRYDAQAGDDTITIENAGAVSPLPGAQSSSTLVIGSNVALAATDDDAINLYASPVDSFQALYGGIGNDLFTLGSTSNEISGILGSVLVEGGDNELVPTVTKNVIANGNAVAQTLAVGDTLRINDQGYNAAAQYELDDGSFSRDTTVAVTNYGAIETIVLNAGLAANDIDILDTPDDSNTTVRGQDGVDNVTVTLTGDGSILGVSTKGANDVFEFTNTGVESVSHVFMGDGDDMATQVTSGAGSGIRYDAQAGDDTITIENAGAVSPLPGAQSSSTLVIGSNVALAATDDDAINLYASPVDSFQALYGGIGNDLFTLGSTSNEISGILGSVLVEGGDETDTLTINDQGHGDNAQYNLDVGTFNRDPMPPSPTPTVANTEFDAIETINLNAGTGNDDINVLDTPANSTVTVDGNLGDDVIDVTGTGVGSSTNILGSDGNDSITVDGSGIQGDVFVDGAAPTPPAATFDVVGRRSPGLVETKSVTIPLADTFFYIDSNAAAGGDYILTPDMVVKAGAPTITYDAVEKVEMKTSRFGDNVTIIDTLDNSLVELVTDDGDDTVEVITTGESSATQIFTGLLASPALPGANSDDDTVIIDTTGGDSLGQPAVVLVNTAAAGVSVAPPADVSAIIQDIDTVEILATGIGAGVSVVTGDATTYAGGDQDLITIGDAVAAPPPIALSGSRSVISVASGPDDDTFEINEVFLETVVDLQGEGGNDVFNLNAAGVDSTGNLIRLNDDPINSPGLDDVAKTRELFIDGGDNGPGTQTVVEGASVVLPNLFMEGSVPNVPIGDAVNVLAGTATGPLDLRYLITGPSQGVLATTEPAVDPSMRSEIGNEVVEPIFVERINIETGSGEDVLTIQGDIPLGVQSTGQLIEFDGGGSDDRIEVLGSSMDDRVTIGPTGGDVEPIQVNDVSYIRVDGNAGDDQISNRTNSISVLNGGDGSDTLLGGGNADALTGGSGVDFLFGNDGDDFLLSDQAFGETATFSDSGEIINGGNQVALIPGDVCIQFGADDVFDCEFLGDGGGTKDVLTWLRAIIVPATAVLFDGSDPRLAPFDPVAATPQTTLSTTEPSSLSPAVFFSLPVSATPLASALPLPLALDVNADGKVTAVDAVQVINLIGNSSNGQAEGNDADAAQRNAADVNFDGNVTPLDALLIINELSRTSPALVPVASEQIELLRASEGVDRLASLDDGPATIASNIEGIAIASSDTTLSWAEAVDQVIQQEAENDAEDESGEAAAIDLLWEM